MNYNENDPNQKTALISTFNARSMKNIHLATKHNAKNNNNNNLDNTKNDIVNRTIDHNQFNNNDEIKNKNKNKNKYDNNQILIYFIVFQIPTPNITRLFFLPLQLNHPFHIIPKIYLTRTYNCNVKQIKLCQ